MDDVLEVCSWPVNVWKRRRDEFEGLPELQNPLEAHLVNLFSSSKGGCGILVLSTP
jgi:hypothetical protein